MFDAYLLFTILLGTIILFVRGFWRYDIVAIFALLTAVILGIVPYKNAFIGLANPAVITVACVMVISQAINQSGILDYAVKRLTPTNHNFLLQITILTLITAIFSAFMNNVGALALIMPIAIQASIKAKRSPSLILMPIAFASVLGGLTTAIGTPPNLLISAYRQQITGHAYAMFDFAPVGIVVATVGILFIIFIGWRLLPTRNAPKQADDLFKIQDYLTEIKIPESSPMIGKMLYELEHLIEGDFLVVGLIRKKKKRLVIPDNEVLEKSDILIIEANHHDIQQLLEKGKLELVTGETITSDILRSDDIGLIEAVVPQGSRVEGRSSQSMRLRSRYNINLVAIARQGNPYKKRLNHVNLRAGDVVLIQGDSETLQENVASVGLLPLVERGVQVGFTRKAFLPSIIFLIAIIVAALQILPVQISFACAVATMVLTNAIPTRKLYDAIDWPIIALLAAMIPLGQALQTTGATGLIANSFTTLNAAPFLILGLLFVITMTLSDIMNNAATAVVMAPIAATIAKTMGMSIDPFLMTVAVAASCSFLTPISHQNNTLVMGPGGYKFFDYFRMGLLLEIVILVVAIPIILWIWPYSNG